MTALFLVLSGEAKAVEVVLVGDTQLKLTVEVISGIKKALNASISTFSTVEARGTLRRIVEREQPQVVIALGKDALNEAQDVPRHIPIVFGVVITPPATPRANTTGVYLAVPAGAYAVVLEQYLPAINHVAVIGSPEQLLVLDGRDDSRWRPHPVKDPVEFVDAVKRLTQTDAILLLPNAALLTPAAMEETFLLSYRKGIPLLGVSERQVRDGALLSLVADLPALGVKIGELATAVLNGAKPEKLPPVPVDHFLLYVNTSTAKSMGIAVPGAMLRAATRVYP